MMPLTPTPSAAHRDAAIAVVAAVQQLVDALALADPTYSLSVNFHGPMQRIDIARLTPDGQHIQEWLAAISASPSVEEIGLPLSLPTAPGPVH